MTHHRHFHPHHAQPDQLRRAVDFAREETAKRASLNTRFSALAAKISQLVGSAWMFIAAFLVILAWGISGPLFHFSDTWQLVINTGTTIITFLIVFLIQNTQNRDAKALHLKLNELIHAVSQAHDELIDVEKLSDEELKTLEAYYERVREECARRRESKSGDHKAA